MAARRASWQDIRSELQRRIGAREWQPGAAIPNEEVLAVEFGAARATVNRALQDLARSGVIERRRKAGSRVALHPVREARFSIPLVRREVEARGAVYGYELIEQARKAAPEAIAARMGLPEGSQLLQVRALHRADGAPYQYEDRWINPAAVDLSSADFSASGPNEWLVENTPFSQAEFAFQAAAASPQEADMLGLQPGQPVFVAERLTFVGEKPVTFVRMVHPSSHRMVTRI